MARSSAGDGTTKALIVRRTYTLFGQSIGQNDCVVSEI
jgi:hypothetical protein